MIWLPLSTSNVKSLAESENQIYFYGFIFERFSSNNFQAGKDVIPFNHKHISNVTVRPYSEANEDR